METVATSSSRQIPKRQNTENQAPGPKGRLILGLLPERRKDPLGLFLRIAQEYGPVAHFKIGPRSVVLLSDSDAIKHVLVDNSKNYIKGFGYDKLEPILGKGLLTNEGESWRQQRKLAQPAFHRQRLQSLTDVMATAARSMVDEWDQQTTLDVHEAMNRLTMKIVSTALLGTDIAETESAVVGRALAVLIAEANRRMLSLLPVPLTVPTPRNLKSRQSIRILNEVVYRLIREHKNLDGAPDLLQMLMVARDDESGKGMSDTQLRDEVMTIFLAGHETTANALTWTLYLLSMHPEVERKLFAEVRSVLGDGGRVPSFEDLPRLRYTQMVIEESLRVFPPAWIISRQAEGDDTIGGFAISKGTIVVMCPYVMHRSEKYWQNPEGFDPERFADPEAAAKRPKFAYFPFGGGPRQCIGNHFAMMEAQIVLATMINRFRFSLVPGFPVEPEPLITLRPRYGMKMRLQARRSSPDTNDRH